MSSLHWEEVIVNVHRFVSKDTTEDVLVSEEEEYVSVLRSHLGRSCQLMFRSVIHYLNGHVTPILVPRVVQLEQTSQIILVRQRF